MLALTCSAVAATAAAGGAAAQRKGTTHRAADAIIDVARLEKAFGPVAGLVGPLKNVSRRLPPSELQDWSFDRSGSEVVSIVAYKSVFTAHRESVLDISGRIHRFVPCVGCQPLMVFCLGCLTQRVRNVLLIFERGSEEETSPVTARQRMVLLSDLAKLGTPVSP